MDKWRNIALLKSGYKMGKSTVTCQFNGVFCSLQKEIIPRERCVSWVVGKKSIGLGFSDWLDSTDNLPGQRGSELIGTSGYWANDIDIDP